MDNNPAEQAVNPEAATNSCCDEWKRKHSKAQEARSALRQATKLLEQRINQVEAHNANLKKAYQEEQARTKIETEEKLKESEARVSLELEVSALKSQITAMQQKVGADAQDRNGDVRNLEVCLSERETEINRLKELLVQEKKRADSERMIAEKEKKKAAETRKLLKAEKNKSADIGRQLARIEARKAEEFRLQQAHFAKETEEAKKKLASETLKFRDATKKLETDKQKLVVEMRNAESETSKAQKRVEVEKQKTAQEKRRADAESIKTEEQKKLAEDNWKKAMETKLLVDEMSQKLAEDKRTIEDLKRKVHELSSLRKPNEVYGVPSDNAESTKVQQLKDCLKLQKVRAKIARKKYELEASRHSQLQHEISLIQLSHRIDMLDASFPPVPARIHGLTKSQNMPNLEKSNVTSQVCNIDMSQMYSQVDNELMNPCDTTMNACGLARKNMQDTTCVALSERNYDELVTGVNPKLASNKAKLQREMNKSVEGGRETVSYPKDNIQPKSDRADKKMMKSHKEKAYTSEDEKEGTEETNTEVSGNANSFGSTGYPESYTLISTQACRERTFNFAEVEKFLELDEETASLISSLPDIETFDMGPSDTDQPTQAEKAYAKLSDMQTSENLRATFMVEPGIGSIHNQLSNVCFVLADVEDNCSVSRTFCATKKSMARCSLDTQKEWAIASILTAVKVEEMPLQKEKHSVLLTLLLFNFTKIAAMKFGELWSQNLILCLNSYFEHICKVMTDVETRTLLLENFSLHELLCLIEDFLREGKVTFKNIVLNETLSKSYLRTDNFMEGADRLSLEVASSEQLVAASIILASLCVAIDHVGYICKASYNILRFCRWDSLTVLTILHIFANLGGREFFDLAGYGLMVTVLKSLVMFLEAECASATSASFLPSIDQLHAQLCTSVTCPFSEGVESIDIVTSLLLEKIKNCLLGRGEQFDSLSVNYNSRKWSNREVVQCASGMNCDISCSLKKHMVCPTQPDVGSNFMVCQLSDLLSLLELVANKLSWKWTNVKLVPKLFNMMESCVVQNFVVAIIVLLGQLGRLGVDVGGYEDRGVENLRRSLCSYLCCNSFMKAGPVQIATVTALFGLLPLHFETLLHTEFTLPASSSESVTYAAENLRKWFFGLGKDQQDLLYDFLGRADEE